MLIYEYNSNKQNEAKLKVVPQSISTVWAGASSGFMQTASE